MRPYDIQEDTPASALLTTAVAKAHLRVDSSDEDTYIDALVLAATKYCESYMHRQILSAGYTVMFDSMPPDNERIYIPKGQLSAIATFKYYDVDGDIQTWDSSNYQINTLAQPGYVMPVENGNYPSVQASTWNAVQIAFNCGWATTADVPEDLLHAVKLAISHLFENRDMSPVIGASALNVKMPQAVHSLLDIYSLREFA